MSTTFALRRYLRLLWPEAYRLLPVLMACSLLPALHAQSTNAGVSGRVLDQQNAVIPEVEVEINNVDTGATYTTKTNGEGFYSFPNLPPGEYLMNVRKQQFKTISVTGITLHVQDEFSRNFMLQVGSADVSVTVTADQNNINVTDGTVSTVVDRQFVENIPLNGRSFQSLISLTPGVLIVPSSGVGQTGEITVNGQRTEANYFTVDGVSANTGSDPLFTGSAGTAGGVPSETAVGTTQSIISLDALQEFRATTSTYSAEYGRTPGGQFSFVSRSGTNQWHGSAFNYFRNEVLDANNWFNNLAGLPRTAERQNDFGGTLGGPVSIPGLYNGKNKTFFFFSYEGLRLRVPAGAVTGQYPDAALRQNASSALRQYLNAFPVPNGPEVLDAGQPTGLAFFTSAYSNPSSLDAASVRVDHHISKSMNIFGRYSWSPSSASRPTSRDDLANSFGTIINVKTLTVGATNLLSPRLYNDLRFNYTLNDHALNYTITNLGGAQPIDLTHVPGFGPSGAKFSRFQFQINFGAAPQFQYGPQQYGQKQWNLVDAVSLTRGSHNMKLGVDYRRLSTRMGNAQLEEAGFFDSVDQIVRNAPTSVYAASEAVPAPQPIYLNFSAYAQDEWKVTHRLALSLGMRWELIPPPGNANGNPPYTVNQITDLNTAHLAPAGTPLWQTDYHAFAPRIGAAFKLLQSTVVRGGFGIFYDMGNTSGSNGFQGVGFGSFVPYNNGATPFPLTAAQVVLPPASVAPPYNKNVYAFDPQLKLPYTMEWNMAVEQSLGADQAITLTYLGSAGRRLLFSALNYYPPNNPNFSPDNALQITTNKSTSDYDALQAQFKRKLSRGIQVLASYTWSHGIDDLSTNSYTDRPVRSSSDFDVRHNFQLAGEYEVPGRYSKPLPSAILSHWGLSTRISAHTAFPVDVINTFSRLPDGSIQYMRPNLVPGAPAYVYGAQYPGGRILNFNAFQAAPDNTQGTLPRNFGRGFNAVQADLTLRREFPVSERLHVQFRADAFNLFNHPNFSNIDQYLFDGPYNVAAHSGFGGTQSTLNNSLGGLSPLYQMGGPRSLQLSLRVVF